MVKAISESERTEIIRLNALGLGSKKICKKLKIHVNNVKNWLRRYRNTKQLKEIRRSGRPLKFSVRMIRAVVQNSQKKKRLSVKLVKI